jgi:hypothetical protein
MVSDVITRFTLGSLRESFQSVRDLRPVMFLPPS